MKIVFWGAGGYGENALKQVMAGPQPDEYLAVLDNNPALWGKSLHGIKIAAPSEVDLRDADLVVVTSIHDKAIRKQLTEELGVSEKQIYAFPEYLGRCFADSIYRKRYNMGGKSGRAPVFDTGRFVVYTAVTGDYDELKDPLVMGEGLTYVCLTNNPSLKSKTWQIEYVKDEGMDNIHLARHIKMNPHIYFREYDTSVWVDGKFQIMDDLRLYAAAYQRESPILCFPHPDRECICDEVAACIMLKKADKACMLQQAAQYLKEGYPVDYGLYDTGCMVRAHNDRRVAAIMDEWEKQLQKHSVRDQLSFPYVCWKSGFTPDICDMDIRRNRWLEICSHKHEKVL